MSSKERHVYVNNTWFDAVQNSAFLSYAVGMTDWENDTNFQLRLLFVHSIKAFETRHKWLLKDI